MNFVQLGERLRDLDQYVSRESLGELNLRVLRRNRNIVDGSEDSLFKCESRRCQIPSSKEIRADLRESFSLGLQHLRMRFRDVELSDLYRAVVIDRNLDCAGESKLGHIISRLLPQTATCQER